jgi:ABC-type sugar transport system ATPase subunit
MRPEHVKLVNTGGIAGTLDGAEDHDVEMILTITVGDHFICAAVPPNIRLQLNASVRLDFVRDKMHFSDAQTTENLSLVSSE